MEQGFGAGAAALEQMPRQVIDWVAVMWMPVGPECCPRSSLMLTNHGSSAFPISGLV